MLSDRRETMATPKYQMRLHDSLRAEWEAAAAENPNCSCLSDLIKLAVNAYVSDSSETEFELDALSDGVSSIQDQLDELDDKVERMNQNQSRERAIARLKARVWDALPSDDVAGSVEGRRAAETVDQLCEFLDESRFDVELALGQLLVDGSVREQRSDSEHVSTRYFSRGRTRSSDPEERVGDVGWDDESPAQEDDDE
jgi:hypothetical protein